MINLDSGKKRLKRGQVYILVVIALVYKLFYLVPWVLRGSYYIGDLALILIWAGVGWLLFSGARARVLGHPLSILVFLYLFLVLTHISLARFHYDQSIVNGLIHARNQFMYVAFFLYAFLLDTSEDIARLLDVLSLIAVVLLVLSVISYFFPVVFHEWRHAEGSAGIRSGVRRGTFPAMPLMNLAAVWMMSRWVCADKNRLKYALAALWLIAGHFFVQSRGQLISLIASIVVMGILTGSYRELRNILGAALAASLIMAVALPENILISLFTSTVEDVSEGTGTIKGRLAQAEHGIKEFMEHPWIGSGLIVLRSSVAEELGSRPEDLFLKTKSGDLGYPHWIKMYGIAGIIWLTLVMYILGTRSLRVFRSSHGKRRMVSLFAVTYFCFYLISGVILNHFLIPSRIIIFVLLFAIVVTLDQSLDDGPGRGQSKRQDPVIGSGQNPRILRSRQIG